MIEKLNNKIKLLEIRKVQCELFLNSLRMQLKKEPYLDLERKTLIYNEILMLVDYIKKIDSKINMINSEIKVYGVIKENKVIKKVVKRIKKNHI